MIRSTKPFEFRGRRHLSSRSTENAQSAGVFWRRRRTNPPASMTPPAVRSRRTVLLLGLLALLLVPLVSRLLVFGSMPNLWGAFPPPQSPGTPGFSWLAFVPGVLLAAGIVAFFVAPRCFGFRPVADGLSTQREPPARVGFPPWCILGALVCAIGWALMWGWVPGALEPLIPYSFVPLWWGFILVLDGLVFRRTGGNSLVARRPTVIPAIAVVSCVSWYYFEYLNYFTRHNWYYPHDELMSTAGYLVWFGLAFTTVMPSIFVVYQFLTTFNGLRTRHANGPRLQLSRRAVWGVLWLGLASLALLVIWPAPLFPLLWIGPLAVMAAALSLAGFWTPFSPIALGNWAPMTLMALACAVNYFVGEMWNFFSTAQNPNYWRYDVPYVNVLKIFEMPALGYFGYLPFGVLCWTWWVHHARLFGVDPAIDVVAGAGPLAGGDGG